MIACLEEYAFGCYHLNAFIAWIQWPPAHELHPSGRSGLQQPPPFRHHIDAANPEQYLF